MHKVNVIIGDFHRRNFTEGLLARLSEFSELSATVTQTQHIAVLLDQLAGPKVLILDAMDHGFDMDDLPKHDPITVIVISDEGRTADVRLHQIDASQIAKMVLMLAGKPRVWHFDLVGLPRIFVPLMRCARNLAAKAPKMLNVRMRAYRGVKS